MMLDIRSVVLPFNRRPLADVMVLAEDIKANGLKTPLDITENNVLIHGARRLAALRHLKRLMVKANVITRHQINTRMAEILEAIRNEEGTRLSRSYLVREWKELYEGLHPDRPSRGKVEDAPVSALVKFCQETGKDMTTTERMLFVARYLSEEAKAIIKDTVLEDNFQVLWEVTHVKGEAAEQAVMAQRNLDALKDGGIRRPVNKAAELSRHPVVELDLVVRPKQKGLRRPYKEKGRIEDVLAMVTRARNGYTQLCNEWDRDRRIDMGFAMEARPDVINPLNKAIEALKDIVEQCQ